MSAIERKRRESLQSFRDLCDQVGFELEPFQVKIAGALLGTEREKLVTLPRKNGKSRLAPRVGLRRNVPTSRRI